MKHPDTIILATENHGKIIEMTAILRRFLPESVSLLSLKDLPQKLVLPPETGRTFCENARIKAEFVWQQTHLTAIGDDSGLCVDALAGAPGLYSRRWDGVEDNDAARNGKLLDELAGKTTERTAAFICCVAMAGPGETLEASGTCKGQILEEPRGTAGFGYDPLFMIDGTGQTMAQVSSEYKNRVSHRASAIEALVRIAGWC